MAPWEEHPDKPYVQPFPVPLVFFGAPPGSTTGARPGLIGRPHKGILGKIVWEIFGFFCMLYENIGLSIVKMFFLASPNKMMQNLIESLPTCGF